MASKHQLTIIAQLELARGCSKNVEGMEGFLEYYIKSLPNKDRHLCHRYLTARDAEINSFTQRSEADGWSAKA